MKKIILLLVTISLSYHSYSQSQFRRGFIVTLSNDSTYGFVRYRESSKSFSACEFKASENTSVSIFSPDEIIGYGFVNDRYFISSEIPNENNETGHVFLEVIVNGQVSLFRHESYYFVQKNGDRLIKLSNELVETEINGNKGWVNVNKHVRLLNTILYDCETLSGKIQNARLNEKYLSRLIQEYNSCRGENVIVYKSNKAWFKARFGLFGGSNVSTIDFSNLYSDQVQLNGSFEKSISPSMGVSFDFLSPRVSEQFSLHWDVFYSSPTYHSYSLFDFVFDTRNYVTISVSELKIPVALRWTLPVKGFYTFFNAGVSPTINLSTESKWIEEVELGGVVVTSEYKALDFKEYQFGFWGGMGLIVPINKMLDGVLDLRYEMTNGISGLYYNTSSISNFQFTVGIRTK